MSTPVASASATPDANSPAARLQAATAAYQALQTELSNAVEARQRRETQLTETGMVKEVCIVAGNCDRIRSNISASTPTLNIVGY